MSFRTGIFLILFILFLLTGCTLNLSKQTFSNTNDGIKKELIELVKKEYNHNINVEIFNKTINVYFPVNNLLKDNKAKEKELNKKTAEKIDRIIFLIHRVAFSSDNNLDFYVITTTDMETGNELLLIGYFYDVYRVRLLNISKGEFSQRLVNGLNENIEAINDWDGKFFKTKEIFLPDFLASQIAQRIRIATSKEKNKLENNKFFSYLLQDKKPEEKFEAKKIQWGLKDKIFTFVLEIPDYQEKNAQEVFNLILKTTAHVLYSYDFDYNAVRILVRSKSVDKKIFFINKKELELFRKEKIKIENLIGN